MPNPNLCRICSGSASEPSHDIADCDEYDWDRRELAVPCNAHHAFVAQAPDPAMERCLYQTDDYGTQCRYNRHQHEQYASQMDHEFWDGQSGLNPECGDPGCSDCVALAARAARLERERQNFMRDFRQRERALGLERRGHIAEARDDADGVRAMERESRGCTCEACKFSRFEDSVLHDALVASAYSAPTGGWQPRGLGRYWLGVELETQQGRNRSNFNASGNPLQRITNQIASSMGRPEGFWHAKQDGSVTGPEFASHPATLEYWRDHEGELREMFRMLIHSGYRSHDGDRAGMHVSFSKSAMDDSRHLYRLLGLIHRSPDWSLAMSQRTYTSASQWAKLDTFRTPTARRDYCRLSAAGRSLSDRYVALNHPGGREGEPHAGGRYEFRLPRGTLRFDRFMKNLEWVVGMIEFTRFTTDTTASSPKAFMEFVADNRLGYPNLFAFIEEKELRTRRLNRSGEHYPIHERSY